MIKRRAIPFANLLANLRPEDKLALIYFFEDLRKGSRPLIKTRRGDNITTILSYSGLIVVNQKPGQWPEVREFTRRGVEFHAYLNDRVNVAELVKLIPDADKLRSRKG